MQNIHIIYTQYTKVQSVYIFRQAIIIDKRKPFLWVVLDMCLRNTVSLRVEYHAEVAGGGANSYQIGKYNMTP